MSEYDWDDTKNEWDDTDTTPAVVRGKNPPNVVMVSEAEQKDEKRKELVELSRKLNYRDRILLKCVVNASFHQANAIRTFNEVLRKAGSKPRDRSDLYRTMRRPDFKRVVQLYTDMACEAAGLEDPRATLIRINGVVEDAMTPVPMIHQGQAVYLPSGEMMTEVDRGSALKGLELIGKSQGAFAKDEENKSRVTVVLDFTGEKAPGETEGEIVDGEFAEIPRNQQ